MTPKKVSCGVNIVDQRYRGHQEKAADKVPAIVEANKSVPFVHKESYLNHLGKLAFKHIYWHVLLPGLPIPMLASRMSTLGKHKHYLNEL